PRLAGVVASTIGLGFAVHAVADAAWPRLTAGASGGEGALAHGVGSWILLPSDPKQIANFAFVILIGALLGLTLIEGVWRTIVLVPTIYLAAFVWENLLIQQTAGATRFLLLGALLVVLMNARPQGLFGTARVEII
nr:hypothetical protein [Actinomycetota bacterium]